ncbi:MAG: O-antigen ligase family protein [Abitibacteriaceae bacterium]|nr:O-antigen ligase family protein [Abditibacteriaceae bacterium]
MAKSKTASRDSVTKIEAKAKQAPTVNVTTEAATRPLPLSFTSLPEAIAFLILCLVLLGAPSMMSGFWPASLEIMAGAAFQPLAMLLGLSACACLLLALSSKRVLSIATTQVDLSQRKNSFIAILLGAFFLWCCLSALTTVYLHDTLLELARIGGCIIWFYIARSLLRPAELLTEADENSFLLRRFWVFSAIVGSALIVCLLGIIGFANAILHHQDPRQFSTFYNPNYFANFCAMALPLSLAWAILLIRLTKRNLLKLPNMLSNMLAFASPLLILMGLFSSSSKGGFLAAIVGLIVCAAMLWRAKGMALKFLLRANLPVVIVIAVLVVAGGALAGKPLFSRLLAAHSSEDHSTMFRYYTWIGTLHMAAARPLFGWGTGNFPTAYAPFEITHYVMAAHEVWLQIAAESGIPALLLLLSTCLAAVVKGWRALRGNDWPIAAGGIGCIAAFAMHGLTDSGWVLISIVLLLIMALALLDSAECGVASAEEEQRSAISGQPSAATHHSPLTISDSALRTPHSALNWSWLGASLVLALAAASVQRVAGAEDANFDSLDAFKKGDANLSLQKAREATQTDPLNARAWVNLARLQGAMGQISDEAFTRATQLQPTRAGTWRNWAEAKAQQHDLQATQTYFDKAIALDPKGTNTRLARAQWLLSQPQEMAQAKGWQDLEYIAQLAQQPYGRFPATPELVNLDFTRAYVKLAGRALQNGHKAAAQDYIQRGLADVQRARKYEAFQRQLADIGVGNVAPAGDLDELETSLKTLQERAR